MKRFVLIVMVALAILMVSPVSAVVISATANGTLYRDDTLHMSTPTEICAEYGLAPFAPTTWYRGYFQSVNTWSNPYSPSYSAYHAIAGPTGIYFDNVSVNITPVWTGGAGDLMIASFVEESACAGGSFYPGKWYNYINTTSPGGQVNAEFSATPLIAAAPQVVSFTDLSTGANILTWYWEFGDGESRLQQNPFKTYSTPGTYRVNLTVTNATSTNTTSKAAYITITNTSALISTKVFATDGSTGGIIVGASLNLRDVENNSWVNATSGMTGTTINVLEGHTLDIYGSYPGVYTASQELGAAPGGSYYLPLMPPLPTPPGGLGGGYVNLIVNTFDSSTNNMLPSVGINARLPTGAEEGTNTGISGTAVLLVPNNTVVILGASKAGYASMSQSFNSGPGADKIVNVKLVRAVVTTAPVTPVVTDPGTGAVITAVPTIDARTSNQKDLDMMNLLRDNGGTIVSLAIVAILFGLLKMIMKS